MKITITHEAYLKMKYFVDECPHEISGFGKARVIPFIVGEKEIYGIEIYDIEILEQTVSGAHSTINEQDLVNFLMQKMAKKQSTKDYKVWWHSHCEMNAFFSGTDTGTIDASTEFPWLVSIVTNKKGEILTRFDRFGELPQTIEHIELEIEEEERDDLRKWVQREIAKKVKTHAVEAWQPTKALENDSWLKWKKPQEDIEEDAEDLLEDERELEKRGGGQGW